MICLGNTGYGYSSGYQQSCCCCGSSGSNDGIGNQFLMMVKNLFHPYILQRNFYRKGISTTKGFYFKFKKKICINFLMLLRKRFNDTFLNLLFFLMIYCFFTGLG